MDFYELVITDIRSHVVIYTRIECSPINYLAFQ